MKQSRYKTAFNKVPFDYALACIDSLSSPLYTGFSPYTGGPYASMYTGQPWTIRQYAGFSSASESNKFYKENLKVGQKGLSVAFDLATHRGYDSDHERVKADVGKTGVAIDTVADMSILFDGIPLDQMSVSMTMNGAVIPIMAFYIVAAERNGISADRLTGTIQSDILKEFLVRNTYIYPPQASMRLVTDIFKYTAEYMPKFNSISVSGYHMLEAGAPPYLELAFTLADGCEYLMYGKKAGLDIDSFAPRISFFFGIGMDLKSEIAKLRAARMLWEKLTIRAGTIYEKSRLLRMHCQTSGWSLTGVDIENNIGRTAIEALAAVLGGTQSLHTNSMDEAISLPVPATAAIARNTQLYLQKNFGIANWTDLLSGSLKMKEAVDNLIEPAEKIINEIIDMGGMTVAIENGFAKRLIDEAAAVRQARIDDATEKIIGVNLFTKESTSDIPTLQIDHQELIKSQLERLQKVKHTRNTTNVKAALDKLEKACKKSNQNVLSLAIEAARTDATLGEISMAIEKAYGRFRAKATSVPNVYGIQSIKNENFISAMKQVLRFEKKYGRRPRILIAKLGQDGHDRGAKIIAAGFADLGFDVDLGPLFQTPFETAKQALENDVHFIGVSSLAGAHLILVKELIQELKRMNKNDVYVILGGIVPREHHAALFEMGVIAIFGPGTNLANAASQILENM